MPRPLGWDEPLLHALPYARRLQIESRDGPQRWASLAGLALVLHGAECVTGRSFSPRDLSFPLDQKPALIGGPDFSLSHARSAVACIVTSDRGCGLDIEDWPVDAEPAAIEKLRRWTATEAVLKAAGLGLRSVSEVELDPALERGRVRGERFTIQPISDGPDGVIGHVAMRQRVLFTAFAVELDGAELSAAIERSLGVAAQVE